jgi:hypothetical protein
MHVPIYQTLLPDGSTPLSLGRCEPYCWRRRGRSVRPVQDWSLAHCRLSRAGFLRDRRGGRLEWAAVMETAYHTHALATPSKFNSGARATAVDFPSGIPKACSLEGDKYQIGRIEHDITAPESTRFES